MAAQRGRNPRIIAMKTKYITSLDSTRIAYDKVGAGPAIILLHGGGSYRQEWHNAGYVERLQKDFSVITLDLRGHGESDLPEDPASYALAKMGQDILAVADACQVDRFTIWGFSYGGKVGRYLAVQSARVQKIILMGTPFGSGVFGKSRQDVFDFCAHWTPILQAQREGALDFTSLSPEDQQLLNQCHVPAMLGWVPAMLDWPSVEPAEFHCPVLWIVGSEDRQTMLSVDQYKEFLKGSPVQLQIMDGLNHEGVFEEIDTVFERMVRFTRCCNPTFDQKDHGYAI
jgi:pimeloyl-ACP methyl ester carboxylesterase